MTELGPTNYEVEGEFTQHEVKQVQARIESLKLRLKLAQEDLERRRAVAELGEARAEAERIGQALRDPEFVEQANALDAADDELEQAQRAWRRCKRGVKLTRTGEQRRAAVDRATTAQRAARVVFDLALKQHGIEDVWRPYGRARTDGFKGKIRSLIDSYKERDLPERIDEASVELADLVHREMLMRAHRISDERLGAWSRYLTDPQRRLLMRLVIDEYSPKPKTIESEPDFGVLADLGLIEVGVVFQSVKPTPLGHDVVEWAGENEAGVVLGFVPLLTRNELKETFTDAERQAMADKAKALLARVRREDPDLPAQVELGLPENGFSYQVCTTRYAVQRFLKALGVKTSRKGPRVVKRKRPSYNPGKLLALEQVKT